MFEFMCLWKQTKLQKRPRINEMANWTLSHCFYAIDMSFRLAKHCLSQQQFLPLFLWWNKIVWPAYRSIIFYVDIWRAKKIITISNGTFVRVCSRHLLGGLEIIVWLFFIYDTLMLSLWMVQLMNIWFLFYFIFFASGWT